MGHTFIALGVLRGQSVSKTPQGRAYDTPLRASQSQRKTLISYKIKNVSRLPSKKTHDLSLLI